MAELIFNKYEIQTRLAIGGMGEVFYAVQKGVAGFERPAILKSLLPDLAQQEGFIGQFLDAARVAATLNHPNVVSIFEVGLWNGVYFIAMEYIQGRNIAQLLKQSIKQKKPVPPFVTARILRDAALGLHHAHTALDNDGQPLSIVHRDISPQNVMVRDDGVTKIVDFGIARATNRSTRTAPGAVKGKLAYLGPEQLLGGTVSGATDQYALGVVLWEMACGRRLFKSDQELELMKAVLEAKIPRPSTVVAGIPAELDAMAMKMLDRDPARRYGTCAEVAQAFEQFLIGQSGGGHTESPVALYLRALGPAEGPQPTRATPSSPSKNFVISLHKETPAPSLSVSPDAPTGTLPPSALPRPSQPRPRAQSQAAPHPKARSKALVGVLVGVIAMGVGAGAFRIFRMSRVSPSLEPIAQVSPPPQRADPPRQPVPPAVAALPPVAAPIAAAGPGYLTLSTEPWTRVWVGGDLLGSTPIYEVRLAAGTQTLTLVNEGKGIDTTRVVVIKAGEVTRVELKLP